LWEAAESAQAADPKIITCASALALYDPDNPRWSALATNAARVLVTVNPTFLGSYLEALRPAKRHLTGPLVAIFREKGRPETEHTLATSILADYCRDDPELLAELVMDADPKAFRTLFPVALRLASSSLPVFEAELDRKFTAVADLSRAEAERDRLAGRQARAAVALVRMGKPEKGWALLRHSPDPRVRSFIINWLKSLDVDPALLTTQVGREFPRPAVKSMDEVLFDPEVSKQRALIMALGTYAADEIPSDGRQPVIAKLVDLYRNDPDAGIHGAAELTLRRWKHEEKIKAIDEELKQLKDSGERRWFINREGQTFAVINGPVEFVMRSPKSDLERSEGESEERLAIARRFAIATKEVSVEQFRRFIDANKKFAPDNGTEIALRQYSPLPHCPWIGASWYTAAAYCNWLSEVEGLPHDQWCYLTNRKGLYAEGMTIPADVLHRSGYRLPTEAEWEYSCRAGTVTSRYYGVSPELLGKYAWYQANSRERTWPVGSLLPNDLGLFDILGNVFEWCLDEKDTGSARAQKAHRDEFPGEEEVTMSRERICRGGMYTVLAQNVYSSARAADKPDFESIYDGFRIARTCR
jgi:formylglycine-generating enzyme required for sulfatase activity